MIFHAHMYSTISRAIEFYTRSRGYEWIDTPWVVSELAKSITHEGDLERCHGGYLVGSAEQGFIELVMSRKLGPGRYVSAGPCFRFDDGGQPGKHPYFFKVELCVVGATGYGDLVMDAMTFLGTDAKAVRTKFGTDLEIAGIEVGSYGLRSNILLPYVVAYGTGIAEPRFSEAIERARCQ